MTAPWRWRARPVEPVVGRVPRDQVVVESREAAELDDRARRRHAERLIHRTLLTESLRDPAMRNGALVDLCLDLRSALVPSAPDARALRELPGVAHRYAVPVTPGRS